MTISAVVFGGAGYVGGEMLRLIHAHPAFELAAAVSGTYGNKPIASVFPNLAHACAGRTFTAADDWPSALQDGADLALFSAAPHGASAPLIADALEQCAARNLNVHVVDASADFRFADPAGFKAAYNIDHPAPALLEKFASGVPEHTEGGGAEHAGHPGCFATAALLAAVPLVQSGISDNDLFLCGITGSSGSGRSAKPGTHHPDRHSNLYAYQPLAHRHSPEIGNLITQATGTTAQVHFVPHSGPFVRGIHMTLQARLKTSMQSQALAELFRDFYAGSPFVSVVNGTPRLKDVVASNRSHIGVASDGGTVTVLCVIDNLLKGAAGGAMQWMNRLWSLPQETGLLAPAAAWT